MSDRLHAAKSYLAYGWVPLPLFGTSPDGRFCHCPRGGHCGSRGKHPIQSDWASLDVPTEEQLEELWRRNASANVGIRTGSISGIFVLDVDTAGKEAMTEMVRAGGGMPKTTVVQTGSGMWHYYFLIPPGLTVTNSSKGLPKGVDLRGDGGQVVAPPSRSDKGHYRVVQNAPPALPPQWLVDIIVAQDRVVTPEVPQTGVTKRQATDEEARYEMSLVSSQLRRLAALRDKSWNPGDAWDINCFEAACHIIEMCNASYSQITAQRGYELYMENAPHDDKWDDRKEKWAQALRTAGHKAKGSPASLDSLMPEGSEQTPFASPISEQDVTDRIAEADGRVEGEEGPRSDSSILAEFCNESLLRQCYYTPESGWMRWDGKVWVPTQQVVIQERFRLWVGGKVSEAIQARDESRLKFLMDYLKFGRVASATDAARGPMLVSISDFDQQPDLLTVQNGIINLVTGELLPHAAGYFLTKITNTEYHPGATHPDWDTALTALTPEVAEWMRVRIGQAATGHPTWDDLLPICQGGGENGKTSFLAAVQSTLGGHGGTVSERALMGRSGDHPTELTDLMGMRFAMIEETPQGGALNVKRLKDLLGTSTMTARKIKSDSMTWKPTHSLFLTTNYPPRVSETDHGTWRRLALVKFPYRFLKPNQPLVQAGDRHGDPNLRSRLEHGHEGQHYAILAWIVSGAMAWYAANREMPALPQQIADDTLAWRAETDKIFGYLAERIEFDPDAKVLSTELFEDFSAWLKASGSSPWADNTFAIRLREQPDVQVHGVAKRRSSVKDGLSRRHESAYVDLAEGQTLMMWHGMKFRPDENRSHRGNLSLIYPDRKA
ncbi:MAG: phage/plasmid primase, P4 family [Actinomycetota bacterium]|nr:phage/plasmid primase, P4 family [Actinomycetota bacterium]